MAMTPWDEGLPDLAESMEDVTADMLRIMSPVRWEQLGAWVHRMLTCWDHLAAGVALVPALVRPRGHRQLVNSLRLIGRCNWCGKRD